MENKYVVGAVLAGFMAFAHAQGRDDGQVAAGFLGGLAVGTIIGSAASHDRSDDRVVQIEDEEIGAQEQTQRFQQDQERQLDRTKQKAEQRNNSTLMLVLGLIAALMFIVIIGMAVLLIRRP